MNIIYIAIGIGCFLGGLGFFWVLSRNSLIKDINNKRNESDKIISSAKSKAVRLSKEAEKKAKQFRSSQIKKVNEEVETIKASMQEKEKLLTNEKAKLTGTFEGVI